ncbi:glycosyltransferase, partial [Duganella sp. FT94W]
AAEPGLAADAALQRQLADALARAPDPLAPRQLLVDVTNIARNDLRTGIERVVRTELLELLRLDPATLQGLRVEPVYLVQENGRWLCRYARRYTAELLGLDPAQAPQLAHDPVADVAAGDLYYGADFAPADVNGAAAGGLFASWRARGVQVHFVLYDLLPVLNPEFFPAGADVGHAQWLDTIAAEADRLVCISAAVADQMAAWLARPERLAALPAGRQAAPAPLKLAALHLGADIAHADAAEAAPYPLLAQFAARPSFLMVGTIEPRKGHLQALAAFEALWRAGVDVNLVIVGNEGWRPLPAHARRTIPLIVQRLTDHPELNRRLFWLRGVGDAHLTQIYAACDCLLAASEGEGFGLPLIEAALHRLPVLARGLPVFREVAGAHAYYFDGLAPQDLAEAVQAWLALDAAGRAPASSDMPWSTWGDHVRQLLRVLDGDGDTMERTLHTR